MNVSKNFILSWVLSLICFPMAATPSSFPADFECEQANYAPPFFHFSGNASYTSPLGSLKAQKISLHTHAQEGYKAPPSLTADESVTLSLTEGAKVLCQHLSYDSLESRGKCDSETTQGYVVYTDPKVSDLPFQVSCRKAFFSCHTPSEDSSTPLINNVHALREVTISYDHELSAECDTATIFREQEGKDILLLSRKHDAQNICQIHHQRGDHLSGDNIKLSPNTLACSNPKGKFLLSSSSLPVEIKGSFLLWKRNQEKIYCKGPATLLHKELGKLQTSQILSISRPPSLPYKEGVEKIKSLGRTTYIYRAPNGAIHKIFCAGQVNVDQSTQVITFVADDPSLPVTFEDNQRTIHAQTAIIDFDYTPGKFAPKNLFLQGRVAITLEGNSDVLSSPSHKQFALADHADYNLETGSLFLTANEGGTVLFFDELNEDSLSASAIQIRYSEKEKDLASAQGFGKVRMIFNEVEKSSLEKVRRTPL